MEKNFVLNGNKLIADFVGENGPKDSDGTSIFESPNGKIRWTEEVQINSFNIPESFKYHKSWDWLMPVVEKIQSLYESEDEFGALINISTVNVRIVCKGFLYEKGKPMNGWKPFNMDYLYEGIVEFIQWYNKQKIKNMK